MFSNTIIFTLLWSNFSHPDKLPTFDFWAHGHYEPVQLHILADTGVTSPQRVERSEVLVPEITFTAVLSRHATGWQLLCFSSD